MAQSFKPNLGPRGQVVRILLGLFVVGVGILSSPHITRFTRTLILLVGIFFLVEGFAKFCIFEKLLGGSDDKGKIK